MREENSRGRSGLFQVNVHVQLFVHKAAWITLNEKFEQLKKSIFTSLLLLIVGVSALFDRAQQKLTGRNVYEKMGLKCLRLSSKRFCPATSHDWCLELFTHCDAPATEILLFDIGLKYSF